MIKEEEFDEGEARRTLLHHYREHIEKADFDTLGELAKTHPFASMAQYASFMVMAMMVKRPVGELAEGFGLSHWHVLHLVWALTGALDEIMEDLGDDSPAIH